MRTQKEQSQRQRQDIYTINSGSSFKDVYADATIHECDVHMNNSSQAELGMLYTETPEDIAMEKAVQKSRIY